MLNTKLMAMNSRLAPPVSLPLAADGVRHRQPGHKVHQTAIVGAAAVFHPGRLSGVMVQVARADTVMLARHHPAKAGEAGFGLTGAGFRGAAGFRVVARHPAPLDT